MPLCEGNMTICSPEAGNIASGNITCLGGQIVILPSYKGNNCFIMPINILVCNVKKKNNTDQLGVLISFAVTLTERQKKRPQL